MMHWAMFRKSLIQFSVGGWGCVPSLLFDLRPNYGAGNEENGTSFKGPMHALLHSVPPTLQQVTTNPCLHQRLLDTHRQVWSVSWGVTAPFSWVLVHTRFCLCPPSVGFSVQCKFWWLYGEVNGNLLLEDLCHTQVCCAQSPWPCGSPLLTRTSAGNSQTLRGRSGSVSVGSPGAHSVLFETSEHRWLRGMGFDSSVI